MMEQWKQRLQEVAAGEIPTREELAGWIASPSEHLHAFLIVLADRVRSQTVGDAVHLRGLLEFSNHCARNCQYCGLQMNNREITRYRMEPSEILQSARSGYALGYRTFVLQAGEDAAFTPEKLADLVDAIKQLGDVAVTLSVGEHPRTTYALWRQAGADRYLMRFETSNPALYAQLHPGMSFENRFRCLRDLRELGYQVGSGFLVGLPGQTAEHLADDLLCLRQLDVEMAGIGPFIPNPKTPLGGCQPGDPTTTYRVIALARLLLPWANLPATTAIGSREQDGRRLALRSGANVVMPNLTPAQYRSLYELYPGKICIDDTAEHCRSCITGQIQSIGRTVGTGRGDPLPKTG